MSTSPATHPDFADLSLRQRTDLMKIDEAIIRKGGGKSAIQRQHEKGRLTARERIAKLVDDEASFAEFGLWSAHGMYAEHGGAPAAGVVTGVGRVHGRDCMIIANDATVKAGAFFPMTCKKIIRAQNIAHMARLPLLYLVDSAGVFLPLQEDVFPDTDDFGRIFRNNAVISAEGIPQIAAIMGYCVAGGGYLPVLCDTLLMTEGSGLYLAGPALVKAAVGQVVTDEDLGGAKMHAAISGTIDFREKDDESCLRRLRDVLAKRHTNDLRETVEMLDAEQQNLCFRAHGEVANELDELGREEAQKRWTERTQALLSEDALADRLAAVDRLIESGRRKGTPPAFAGERVYDVFTDKPGAQYDVRDLIHCFVDSRTPSGADFDEYKAEYGPSLVCGYGRVGGHPVGIVANQKKVTRSSAGGHVQTQLPGVIYHDSADKAARFIMGCNQSKVPIIFLHDTSGFMVGKESEHQGIIRAGAKMVNAMSNCVVPKIVLILGGSYGAGNYAMCGRAFDPFLSYAWPAAKCAVMGANQATGVLAMIEEKARERKGEQIDEQTHKQILAAVHASYSEQQDIRHAAARGWVDRLIEPHRTREELIRALEMTVGWDYSKAFKTGVLQT
ncbi:MAG: acyl-CoA carboxylase subunit beta [Phycisphaerales bacterium]|nr:acyl-CoA carboxylase subunit beta [Phycisphaerales bacterium]